MDFPDVDRRQDDKTCNAQNSSFNHFAQHYKASHDAIANDKLALAMNWIQLGENLNKFVNKLVDKLGWNTVIRRFHYGGIPRTRGWKYLDKKDCAYPHDCT